MSIAERMGTAQDAGVGRLPVGGSRVRFPRRPKGATVDDVPSPRHPEEWVLEPTEFAKLPERPYQELWFELCSLRWKSLALVPTTPGATELDIAERLVVVGVSSTRRRLALISAEGAGVSDTERIIAMIRGAEERGDRAIVAVDAPIDNPAAAPIVRAVNAAVLVERLGRTMRADLERSVTMTGPNRIFGVVTRPG